MQLDKVVAYHKALADPTRLRMLILLAGGEMSGLELAERLYLTPATITHHAAKLREASLIHERREKNSIFFSLNDYFLQNNASAAVALIYKKSEGEKNDVEIERDARLKETVVKNFFTSEGRLKHLPAQLKKKLIVLAHLASKLEAGRLYEEKEINAFISGYHEDYATIRREFIMHQFMFRENEVYELNPPEMWAKTQA
ncbi:metalloregulator ArsR/SmtB family transcription factor [Cohnella ginsengisoli]|uniref:Metalloregulator ArsR/SmtB family transcription factor n=1 Tax=Cohnella ginsengisoli TaxID=425004 RepID=A0A9X4KH57_9BACL|nr:metalloregulator ArsR/SmtB family transcription factor [Cohnella ginsengisoli]MDG0792102.1 metalloregulator ArsR/SmtB family transcription factor [Cohnella ginsengisoli]